MKVVTTLLAPTGLDGQGFDVNAIWMVAHRIHEDSVARVHGNDGQRSLFDPDSVTMCSIIPWPGIGGSGPK